MTALTDGLTVVPGVADRRRACGRGGATYAYLFDWKSPTPGWGAGLVSRARVAAVRAARMALAGDFARVRMETLSRHLDGVRAHESVSGLGWDTARR